MTWIFIQLIAVFAVLLRLATWIIKFVFRCIFWMLWLPFRPFLWLFRR